MTERLRLERIDTPLGEMLLVCDAQDRLRAVDWDSHRDRLHRLLARHSPDCALSPGAVHGAALQRYFAGDVAAIDMLPVFTRGTGFQCAVWQALRLVPPGETITYTELAARAGRPAAIRAAGAANGANPISLVVPCHRIVGMDGRLTGYGSGLERKRWLIAHEARSMGERHRQ